MPPLAGRMVALDAFSHALTNPLLSPHVFREETFTPAGWASIAATSTLHELAARNLPNGATGLRISMDNPETFVFCMTQDRTKVMTSQNRAFEIGFVLAGAISAGCYSAGVMDFIIEALDDYYVERDKPEWDGPKHDVRVPVVAGASAGGMTAGMAALHMFRPIAHVWPDRAPPPRAEKSTLLQLGDGCVD